MKRLLTSAWVLLLLLPVYSIAQDFELPADQALSSKEDYARHEKDIINAAKWLESKPIGEEVDKRKQVDAYVIKWISGSPTVSVSVDAFVMKLAENNPQLLAVYMAGAARYCIENGYSKDVVKSATAAVKSVLTCFSLGGDVKKNKLLEKAEAADKNGKLEGWVKDKMQSQ